MKRLIAAVKRIRLAQVLTVFLASVLFLFTTACNGAVQASSPTSEPNQGIPGYRSQPYEGGINNYSDVDSRLKKDQAAETAAKAKGLKDSADRNVSKGLKSFGDKAEQAGDDVKDATSNTGAKLRSAGREAASDTRKATDNVADNTKAAGKDLGDDIKQAAKETSDFVKGKVNEVTDGAERAIDRAS